MSNYVALVQNALDLIRAQPDQSDEWKEQSLATAIQVNDIKTGLKLSVDAYRNGARLILFKEGLIRQSMTLENTPKKTSAQMAKEIIAKIKSNDKNKEIAAARSTTTNVVENEYPQTVVEVPDHFTIPKVDISGCKTAAEIDRTLYEDGRRRRIQARLDHEKTQLAVALALELTGPKEISESRSPFDCLREPWTMASWAKQS